MDKVFEKDLIENYDKYSKKYFADKYGVSEGYIYCLGWKLGLSRTKKWETDKGKIIEDYKKGATLQGLAKKYKHDTANLKKFLIKNGCSFRDASESHRVNEVNQDYFNKIDSPKKAYWLGFIYGDGNVHQNKLQIGLHKKDQCLLEDFLRDIESSHKIYFDRDHPKMIIRSFKIVKDLNNLGVFPRKSLTLKPPSEAVLPEEFVRFFILGFFDADGHVTNWKKRGENIGGSIGFTGTKPMVEWVSDKMKFLKGIHYLRQEKRNDHGLIWTLRINMDEKKNHFFDFFYRDHSFGLKRKKDRFYVR